MSQHLESLEGRRLFSMSLAGGTLTIDGKSFTNDDFIFSQGPAATQFTVTHRERFTNDPIETRTFMHSAVNRIVINCGAGSDRVAGASAILHNFNIDGGTGDDLIGGSPYADIIKCGTGNDTVFAGDSNDSISGEGGDDSLFGEGGNDFFDGGLGKDDIHGGAGSDTAVFDSQDTIDLGGGTDGVRFTATQGNDHVHVSRRIGPNGPQVVINCNGRQIAATYKNGETVTVVGLRGNDVIEMDRSAGAFWSAHFFGGVGNDRVYGAQGNDLLNGGPGFDDLFGGGGHDKFVDGVVH